MSATIIAATCRICRREFEVPLGPESYSDGKFWLSEHLLSDHTPAEVVAVYACGEPWWKQRGERTAA